MRLALLPFLLVCLAPLARSQDLGDGLAYARIHALPSGLPKTPSPPPRAWIVDVRYVEGGPTEAALLATWVNLNARPSAPVFLLVNEKTSAALLAPFARRTTAGLILVGPRRDGLRPDIAVGIPPETERKAYQALETGSPVASLVTDNPGKPRIDEEKLTKEHIQDVDSPDQPVEDPAHPSPPPPLIDAVLQRAIQVERGLAALRKL